MRARKLIKVLKEAGFYTTDVAKCPAPYKKPTKNQIERCKTFLLTRIEIIKPRAGFFWSLHKLAFSTGLLYYLYGNNRRNPFQIDNGHKSFWLRLLLDSSYSPRFNALLKSLTETANTIAEITKIMSPINQSSIGHLIPLLSE